ncbi:hypothetical protein C805_02335 [Eubacterium sp. 14-2]|uniref:hypothetical protein n=1 Tax=Eubacterium sp. 14-2 TaxID=1235790 RepID=UPI000335E6AB|nr:hypothetical protein [Eubacterium sp. 14-2]EOT24123.1 hypothetical protein C805_02335 [Eubacterium sp. 14-2]
MSLIIGIVFTNRAIVISDGRVKNARTDLVVDEKFDKTRKINDNVILGFSGDREFSLWLLEQFENVCKQDISQLKADHVANIFCKIAQEGVDYRKNLKESLPTNFQMVVAGKNNKGIMALYNFGVPTNFEIKEYIPTAKTFVYSVLSPGTKDIDSIFEKVMTNYPGRELEDYINLLFSKASDMDDSINTNLFMKEI